jgi:hypothetical protein
LGLQHIILCNSNYAKIKGIKNNLPHPISSFPFLATLQANHLVEVEEL